MSKTSQYALVMGFGCIYASFAAMLLGRIFKWPKASVQ
jgi:hypothetical protein